MKNVARWMGGAAVALIAIAVAYRYHRSDDLVGAAESLDYRVAEARLTGGFAYRPLKAVFRGAKRELHEARDLYFAASHTSPTDLHALGRSHLLLQRWDSAAETLDDAVRQQTQREQLADALAASTDPELLTDLAAAHHALARHGGEARHYVIAVEAAERAWRLEKTPETAWNRALAIESLHLRRLARVAWRDYLALDPDSHWTGEVHERVQRLAAPTASRLWDKALPALQRAVRAGDHERIASIVDSFRGTARHQCEQTLLPRWAKSVKQPPEETESLALCREVGNVLHRTSGESTLYDTIGAIDRANPRTRSRIIDALAVYGDAAAERAAYDRSAACVHFDQALGELRATGVALAYKAAMYVADCKRFEAGASIEGLDERRYPAVMAQLHWVRALKYVRTGRPQLSIDEYEKAFAIFTALGERDNLAAMNSGFAEGYEYLGEAEGAWRFHLAAVEELDASGSTQPPALEVLRVAAEFAKRERLPYTALLLADQYLLEKNTLRLTRFRTLLLRAELYRGFGDHAAAARDVIEARRILSRMDDKNVRAEFERAPDVVRSRLAETPDPAARERILSDAVDFARERKFSFRLAQLYLVQGVEHAHAGRLDAAKATLYDAAAQIEQERDTVTDDDRRGTLVAARQAIYEALLTVLCRRAEYGEAFDIAERSRARSLLDRVSSRGEPRRDLAPVGAIAASLPNRTALIELAHAGDALVTWIVSSDGVRVVGTRIDRDALERHVDQLRLGGQRHDEPSARRAAAALYDILIRPSYRHVKGFERLIFVPDDRLAGVPFAALLDGTTGRFLVEHHIVSNAPSANIFAACVARDRQRATRRGPALIVTPSTSRASAGEQVLLRATQTEAAEVARQYPQSEVLDGTLATTANFLQRAPNARTIHFAGHAEPRRQGAPRLLFATRANGSPDALYVDDVRSMRLEATRVVVLSACVSGANEPGGLQGTSSLARAFLAAGAPAVIATYWDVEDEAAAELSRRLHVHLARGVEPSAALRLAQLQMLAARDARSAQIGSWAAFAVLGGTD